MLRFRRSSDVVADEKLKDIVYFVDVDDVAALLKRVAYWLEDDARREAKLQEITAKLRQEQSEFKANLYRFLQDTGTL